jgi:hypothetical protein
MTLIKKCYQHGTNIVKDRKVDFVTDSHSILSRLRKYFSQLNVHWVNYIRQTEIQTAEPLVPEPGAFEIEMSIEKLNKTQITRY